MNKLTALTTIPEDKSTPIKSLNAVQLAELQTALVKLGYPAGKIDGKYGHNTRNAWAEFMDDTGQKNEPNTVDVSSLDKLQQMLDKTRPDPGYDFTTKKRTIEAIESECFRQGIGLKSQIAYVIMKPTTLSDRSPKPIGWTIPMPI
jgi:peptidoglycan hydrolase-like protein with peptidoglycan-binding domain